MFISEREWAVNHWLFMHLCCRNGEAVTALREHEFIQWRHLEAVFFDARLGKALEFEHKKNKKRESQTWLNGIKGSVEKSEVHKTGRARESCWVSYIVASSSHQPTNWIFVISPDTHLEPRIYPNFSSVSSNSKSASLHSITPNSVNVQGKLKLITDIPSSNQVLSLLKT